MSNLSPQGAARSLPVLACVSHTLKSALRYRSSAVRIAMPWIVIMTLANLTVVTASGGLQETTAPADMTVGMALRELVLFAVSIVGASSIAVNWHRFILRDQMPATMAETLRLDAPVWRYASFTLLNLLIVLVPSGLLLGLNMVLLPAVPLAVIAVFLAAVLLLRLSLVLPATALDHGGFGYREALVSTRGQMLPLAGLLLVNMGLVTAILLGFALLLMLASSLPMPLNAILTAIVALLANLVLAIYSVSLLSSLYGFYVEGRNF